MKKYILLLSLLILFGIAKAQQEDRLNIFFNDSLKGKWIIDKQCVNETGDCDTSNRNKEYVIFKAIDENDYVSYKTNSYNEIKNGLIKLYIPDGTSDVMIKYSWTLDDFLFFNVPKLIIGFDGINNLSLLENTPIPGYENLYYRDITSTNISVGFGLKKPDRVTSWPNPTDGDLFTKNECQEFITISIFDINGNKVKELALAPIEERRIDLSALNIGAYIFRYRSKSIVGERLIIKNKK